MVFPELRKWAGERGWRVEKTRVYGDYNGYVFTIFDAKGYKAFVNVIPSLTQLQNHALKDFIENNLKKLNIWKYSIGDRVLTIKIREIFKPVKVQEIDSLLTGLTDFLKGQGIGGRDYCSICGSRGNHHIVLFNEIVMPMCSQCFKEFVADVEKMDKELVLW